MPSSILHQYPGKKISLIDVEARRWKAVPKRQHHLDTVWTPLHYEMKAVGDFWGTTSRYGKVYFRVCEDEGVSDNAIQELSSEHILTLSITELPKLLDTSLRPEARQTLLNRLAGSVAQVPLRQDLCDRYYRSESILRRYNGFIGSCNELIKKYIAHRCLSHRPKKEIRYGIPVYVSLTLNGRTYTTSNPYDQSMRMICPEGPVYSITTDDVRHDEAEDPRLHGTDHSKWELVSEDGTILGTCPTSDPDNITWITTPPSIETPITSTMASVNKEIAMESPEITGGSKEMGVGSTERESSPNTPPLQGTVEGVGILNPSTCEQLIDL